MYIGFVNTMYEVVSWVCYKLEENLMQIDSPTTIQCFIRLYEVLSYRMHVFKISFFWVKRIFLLIYLSAKKKKTPQNFFVQVKKTFWKYNPTSFTYTHQRKRQNTSIINCDFLCFCAYLMYYLIITWLCMRSM